MIAGYSALFKHPLQVAMPQRTAATSATASLVASTKNAPGLHWIGCDFALTTRPGHRSDDHYYIPGGNMKTISAADANRHFSRVLREVALGEHVTVVSGGRPVATIAPVRGSGRERQVAKIMLLQRLRRQPAAGARTWTRDELYDD